MDPTPRLPDAAASSRGSEPAIGPTVTDHEAARRLRGWGLLVARVAWLAVVALTLGLAIPGFVVAFDRPELLQQPEMLGLADRLGLPNRALMAAGLLVPMAAVSAIAVFLFWRRSDEWMAMLFSLQLITSIAFTTRSLLALKHAYPAVRAPVQFIWLLGIVLSIVMLCLFPNGRFVPRSTRLLAIAAVVLVVLSPGLPAGMLRLPRVQEEMAVWHWGVAVLGLLALWGCGLAAQVYRYRRVSGPVERQQAKWVMFILGSFVAVVAMGILIPSLFLDLPGVWFAAVLLASIPLGTDGPDPWPAVRRDGQRAAKLGGGAATWPPPRCSGRPDPTRQFQPSRAA